MPDTFVPIVRRPVRRISNDPAVKSSDVSELRKLSIGGDSSSQLRAEEQPSPARYRKTISSLNKEREKAASTVAAPAPRKSSLLDDGELSKLPPPVAPHYEVPTNTSGFPHAPKDNLPKLHETRHKAIKTPVSSFSYFVLHILFAFPQAFYRSDRESLLLVQALPLEALTFLPALRKQVTAPCRDETRGTYSCT